MRDGISNRIENIAPDFAPLSFEVIDQILLGERFRVWEKGSVLPIPFYTVLKQSTAKVTLHGFVKCDLRPAGHPRRCSRSETPPDPGSLRNCSQCSRRHPFASWR